jgi:hypothetical protein
MVAAQTSINADARSAATVGELCAGGSAFGRLRFGWRSGSLFATFGRLDDFAAAVAGAAAAIATAAAAAVSATAFATAVAAAAITMVMAATLVTARFATTALFASRGGFFTTAALLLTATALFLAARLLAAGMVMAEETATTAAAAAMAEGLGLGLETHEDDNGRHSEGHADQISLHRKNLQKLWNVEPTTLSCFEELRSGPCRR